MEIEKPYHKISLDSETMLSLRDEYDSEKMTFLMANESGIEKDFIENKIKILEFKIKERQRKFNLSDEEFYQEFRTEEPDIFINNGNESENIKEFKEHRDSYHTVYYYPSNYIDLQLDFYKTKLNNLPKNESTSSKTLATNTNQYSEIFSNNGFELFNYILENHIKQKGKRGRYADLSYYYWSMYNSTERYIHQRPEVFKKWFCEKYIDSFEKIKTINEVNDINSNRKKHYQTSLDWFKMHF